MKSKLTKLLLTLLLIIFSIVGLKYYTEKVYDSAYYKSKKEYEDILNEKLLYYTKNVKFKEKFNIKKELIDNYEEKKYVKMISKLSENDDKGNIFLFSFIASNKENSGTAAFYLFTLLANLKKENVALDGEPDLDFLDKKTKIFAINQLMRASDSGISNAKYILGKYYVKGKYVTKNEVLGNKLLIDANLLSNGIIK